MPCFSSFNSILFVSSPVPHFQFAPMLWQVSTPDNPVQSQFSGADSLSHLLTPLVSVKILLLLTAIETVPRTSESPKFIAHTRAHFVISGDFHWISKTL